MDKLIGLDSVIARVKESGYCTDSTHSLTILQAGNVIVVFGVTNIGRLRDFLTECLDDIETKELEDDFEEMSEQKKMEALNEQVGN